MRADADDEDGFTFAQATLLLQNLAKAPSHLRDVLLGMVAVRLKELLGRSGTIRAKAARLLMEAPVLTYAETWTTLDPERVSGFQEWASELAAEIRADFRAGKRSLPVGRDYWLDVYLVRAGLLDPRDLAGRRGPEAAGRRTRIPRASPSWQRPPCASCAARRRST